MPLGVDYNLWYLVDLNEVVLKPLNYDVLWLRVIFGHHCEWTRLHDAFGLEIASEVCIHDRTTYFASPLSLKLDP